MAVNNSIKIDKKDFLRALLTDTSPSDVPLIFSNDGLYINLHIIKNGNPIFELIDYIIIGENKDLENDIIKFNSYIPFKYKIKKDEHKLRTLSLVHPASQYTYSLFYKKYAKTINYLCSLSKASIRAPTKITNSFYLKDGFLNNKYKEINIETIHNEVRRKHASSFFSYKGYNRIYNFYKDNNFFNLEKKFRVMWNLDVANCFNNIYTHSIEWAIKGKDYSKSTVLIDQRFPAILDKLMQYSNHSETNGIPIGSEFSRIFSEIIFQRIDRNIIDSLLKKNYTFDVDYCFYRYVDDFILFSKNENIAEIVYKEINDKLSEYNLYLGDSKLKKYNRPFLTEKSNVIIKANLILKELDKTIFVIDDKKITKLIRVKDISKLSGYIINKIKIITPVSSNYDGVSSYIISSLCNRIIQMSKDYELFSVEEFDSRTLNDILLTLFNIIFFFFYTNVTISSSAKITKSIILINNLLLKKHSNISLRICDFISNNINSMSILEASELNDERSDFLSIERINMLILLSNLGDEYLPKKKYFDAIFKKDIKLNYFSIVSFLFIIKNNPMYSNVKKIIEKNILEIISKHKDIFKYSETTHLVLDILSCPYVSHDLRVEIYKKVLNIIKITKTQDEIRNDCKKLLNVYWFVKWKELDLVNLLERKELKSHYI